MLTCEPRRGKVRKAHAYNAGRSYPGEPSAGRDGRAATGAIGSLGISAVDQEKARSSSGGCWAWRCGA